jgi:hypothetical protein
MYRWQTNTPSSPGRRCPASFSTVQSVRKAKPVHRKLPEELASCRVYLPKLVAGCKAYLPYKVTSFTIFCDSQATEAFM